LLILFSIPMAHAAETCDPVVGKSAPIPVSEVLGERDKAGEIQAQLCARFAEALDDFQRQQWTQAASAFEAILKHHPADGPTRFYLARCRDYLAQAPQAGDPAVIYMNAK